MATLASYGGGMVRDGVLRLRLVSADGVGEVGGCVLFVGLPLAALAPGGRRAPDRAK